MLEPARRNVSDFLDHWFYVLRHPVEAWRWSRVIDNGIYGDWRDRCSGTGGNYGE